MWLYKPENGKFVVGFLQPETGGGSSFVVVETWTLQRYAKTSVNFLNGGGKE